MRRNLHHHGARQTQFCRQARFRYLDRPCYGWRFPCQAWCEDERSDQTHYRSGPVRARPGNERNDRRLHSFRRDPRADPGKLRLAGQVRGQDRGNLPADAARAGSLARAPCAHQSCACGGRVMAGRDVFLCDAVRTPIGRFGGALAKVRADDLAAVPIKALMTRNPKINWEKLDEVYFGCANQAGEDNRNVARMALLLAGLPASVPGVTLNRLCASGLEAVGTAARTIRAGEMDLAIAGGVESMTRAPLVQGKAQEAFSRTAEIYDTTIGWRFVNPLMKQQYGIDSMPETGENVAEDYQVTRADQDAFALRSQQRAAKAMAEGYFAEEIVPVDRS